MDKKITLNCGIFLLVLLSLNMISAVITGSETMTRTANSIAVSPGQTFILSYDTIGTSGQWGAIIEDNITGGCLFPSGKNQYKSVMLSDDGKSKQVQIMAPNTTGVCTFNGNYNFGNESIKQFSIESVIIGSQPISLVINTPLNNTIFSSRKISISAMVNPNDTILTLLEYKNSGRWRTMCKNCYGDTEILTLKDGENIITFRANLSDGKIIENSTTFLIDSKDPQISNIKPQSRRYTNGSDFYIKYTEDNCKSLKLLINSQETLSIPCDSGKNIEKFISTNISPFNGLEVEYKLIITDIANNLKESRPTKVKVDTTAPEINDFKAPVVGRYVYFNMTVLKEDKNSFNKIEYIDSFDGTKAKWVNLCSRLDKNNNCIAKKNFKTGTHNLKIKVADKVGNSVEKEIGFSV